MTVYRKCPNCHNGEVTIDVGEPPHYVDTKKTCSNCGGTSKLKMNRLGCLIEGLQIINSMYPRKLCLVVAEHDQLFVGMDDAMDEFDEEDKARMLELGFCIDEDLGKFTFSV
jgi:hypothetical protein